MQRRIILVIGMHQSGTSLIAQALESLGIEFGKTLVSGKIENQKVNYDYQPSVEASLQILKRFDQYPIKNIGLRLFSEGWIENQWVRKIEDGLVDRLEKDLQRLDISFSTPFGIKDPFATLLLPLWVKIFERLEIKFDCVLSLRHPQSVASSVMLRENHSPIETEKMWLIYYLLALRHGCRHIKKVVDYSEWLTAPDRTMKALANALEISNKGELPDSPFVNKLSNRTGPDKIRLDPVATIYKRLRSVQPGHSDWDNLCEEAKTISKTIEILDDSDNFRTKLTPLVQEGKTMVERGGLTERRRMVLFPDTVKKINGLWPPANLNTTSQSHQLEESFSVAVVVIPTPDPEGYKSVGRHSAELISTLVSQGIAPVILDLGSENQGELSQAYIDSFWPDGSVAYERVGEPPVPAVRGPLALAAEKAYWLFEYLKKRHFDVVHAPDFHGTPYFCLRAKEQGLAFTNTRFVVHPVNGELQNRLEEYKGLHNIKQLPQLYLERSTLEIADTVSLPGRDTLRNILDAGIELAPGSIVHYPFRPNANKAFPDNLFADNKHSPIENVLCLPGCSKRGISLFCKSLNRGVSIKPFRFSIIFALPTQSHSELGAYIEALTEKRNYTPAVETVDNRKDLIQLLHNQPNTLCVFPVVDNWNYHQIRDLGNLGAAILVANRGAAAEILANESVEAITCSPLPDAIAKKMSTLLDGFEHAPKPSAELPLPASWITPPDKRPSEKQVENLPLVTVCLMHFERPHLVDQALASIDQQTYPNYEVVMVDDGSLNDETIRKLESLKPRFKKRGWRIIRQQNRYLGAARNSAAMGARGKYLYFLDDDNILKPHALETFVKAAEYTGVDIVAAFSDVFEGNESPDPSLPASRRIIQVGDDLSYGFFRNAFGDSNALVRRSAFLALGGNSEDYAVGLDDMEFFSRAILNGYRLTVVPEALYWARQLPNRLRNLHFNPKAGSIRVCRAYMPHVPPKLRPMLLLASTIIDKKPEIKNVTLRLYFRSLKIRIANTRFGSWLREGIFGSTIHKTLVRLNLNDS